MTDVRVLNLKVHKNGTMFSLEDARISYWCNYISWSNFVIEFHDCVIPSWASFLQKEIDVWMEHNIEKVHNAYNYSEFHIKL